MKLDIVNTIVQRIRRRPAVVVLAFLVLVSCGITSTLAQKNAQKRITSVQIGELAEGSRVSVFSDSALNDYEAFRRGDRFYVRIPLTNFAAAQPNFRGNGFEDVQVQRAGDSVVISFKLQLGATARVDQRSNRLDVIFSSPNKAVRSSSANPTPSRSTTNAIPGIVVLQNSRNQHRRNPDAAGPMPPDSPNANRPRLVTQESNSPGPAPERTSQRGVQAGPGQGSVNRVNDRATTKPSPSSSSTHASASSSANEVKPAANSYPKSDPKSDHTSDSTSTFNPSSTPSYPTSTAVTQSTPLPARPIVSSSSAPASAGWKKRGELARQWVAANRVAASAGAFVLFSLIVFAGSMLYRRRKHVKSNRVKVPGVQPKNSLDNDLEELLADSDAEYDDMHFDSDVSDVRESEVTLTSADSNDSQPRNGGGDWSERVTEPTVAPLPVRWIPATPSIPEYAMKNEVPEREVFEL